MKFVIGGKYQGRLSVAVGLGNYSQDDVFDFAKINSSEYLSEGRDFKTKKIWYNLQEYIRSIALSGTESFQLEKMVKALVEKYQPEVIVMAEVGAGVVPMDMGENIFREVSGRLSVYFTENSEEAYRVVCAIQTRLK